MNEPFPNADGMTEFESGCRYGVIQAVNAILKQTEKLKGDTAIAHATRRLLVEVANEVEKLLESR